MEGRRDEGKEGWRDGGMKGKGEEQKEEWRDGGKVGRRNEGKEKRKDGEKEGCSSPEIFGLGVDSDCESKFWELIPSFSRFHYSRFHPKLWSRL
ncbi:hypothetical protein KOW79_005883 [Hemibagrus wyckioides]|uniref:Uncharacterized protein n=1 Tax=Hemibagrus wyckioides TaxID=337641 RepID=A0A9D3SLZ8_9TELE|nr:hypothetical protein KOW79_005883 [Hemibagrus wyckioides]